MKDVNFEEITLRMDVSRRGGGGIEIDFSSLGYPGEKMTAYQNYLGGGMLGSIGSSNTINAREKFVEESLQKDIDKIKRTERTLDCIILVKNFIKQEKK